MADDKLIEDYDSIDPTSMDISTFVERGSVTYKASIEELSNYLYSKLSAVESTYPVLCGLTVYPSYIEEGSYVTITPNVSGLPELHYEWIFNYNLISTDKILVINSFDINRIGEYYLRVYNGFGEATSQTITLSSNPPATQNAGVPKLISFLTYPLNVNKFEINDTITFDVVAKYTISNDSYYEWYKNGELFTTTTKNKIKINFLQEEDFGSYSVKIFNNYGSIQTDSIDIRFETDDQKILNRCLGFPVKSFIENSVGWNLTESITAGYNGEIGLKGCDLYITDYNEFYVDDLTTEELKYISNYISLSVSNYTSNYSNLGILSKVSKNPFKPVVGNDGYSYDMIIDSYVGNGLDINRFIISGSKTIVL